MSSLRLALKQSLQDAGIGQMPSHSSDEEENEATLQDLEDSEEEEDSSEVQHKAANKIQRHFRNKSKKPGASQEQDTSDDDEEEESRSNEWTIEPPHDSVRNYMAGLSAEDCREHMTPGLRVRVKFDGATWYGGRVTAVSEDKSRIRIQYDDSNNEVTNFPDGKRGNDIVVDDLKNGAHDPSCAEAARFFQPPAARRVQPVASFEDGEITEEMAAPSVTIPAASNVVKKETSAPAEKQKAAGEPSVKSPRPTAAVSTADTPKPKRKRGRPRKHPLPEPPTETATEQRAVPQLKIRMPNNNKGDSEVVGAPNNNKPSKNSDAKVADDSVVKKHAVTGDNKGTTLDQQSQPTTKKLSIRIPIQKVKQSLQEVVEKGDKPALGESVAIKQLPHTLQGDDSNLTEKAVGTPREPAVALKQVETTHAKPTTPRTPKSPRQPKKYKKKKILQASELSTKGMSDNDSKATGTLVEALANQTGKEASNIKSLLSPSGPTVGLDQTKAAEQKTAETDSFSASEGKAGGLKDPTTTSADAPVLHAVSAEGASTPTIVFASDMVDTKDLLLENNIRSERRAAQQANERIVAKQDVLPDTKVPKKKKKRDRLSGEEESEDESHAWVCCDSCGKWRIIPGSAARTLPKKWYCSDNVYDPKHASCDAPQESEKQLVKKDKKLLKKRQRMMKEHAGQGDSKEDLTKEKVQSPRPPREDADKPTNVKRTSPVEGVSADAANEARSKKEKKKGRPAETVDGEPAPEVVVKRGRGRPRRNPNKEAVSASAASNASLQAETDNLEWVQCEKCQKWRKLAPHVSSDDLPEVWTCDMNDWNTASASCDTPEDKAEGLLDIGVFGGSGAISGKLTYRNLIFGGTGRKPNRPISERTRAAESLFAVQFDEDEAPSKVLYADSSAYVCRGRPNLSIDDNGGMSILQLMSKSHVLQELRAATQPLLSQSSSSYFGNPTKMIGFTYDNLPRDIQQPMKDFLLHVLGESTKSLTDEELVSSVKSINADALPVPLRTAHPFCTINVAVTTLCELVKEGKVDCISSWSGERWNPLYRRRRVRPPKNNANNNTTPEPTTASAARHSSRCMKISKPWKRARFA